MTQWELRGYLDYPNSYSKPKPGTAAEIEWSKGWIKSQRERDEFQQSDWHKHLEDDYWAGRDTYAAEYKF